MLLIPSHISAGGFQDYTVCSLWTESEPTGRLRRGTYQKVVTIFVEVWSVRAEIYRPLAEIQALQGDKVHHSGRQVPSPLLELLGRGRADPVVYLLVLYLNLSDFVFFVSTDMRGENNYWRGQNQVCEPQ